MVAPLKMNGIQAIWMNRPGNQRQTAPHDTDFMIFAQALPTPASPALLVSFQQVHPKP
jgi:hypothetical protein